MLPQIENLYFYSVNLYFYMVKKEIVWGNYDFFIWSKRVFTRSKISVLLGQMDFYMVSKNENNNSGGECARLSGSSHCVTPVLWL